MSSNRKIKISLAICSIIGIVIFVFLSTLIFLIFFAPSQTNADKKLSAIKSEVEEIPLAMRYSTLVGEDFELNIDEVLENNGYNSDADECLASYNGKVYFVFTSYLANNGGKRVWNIATVNFDGTDFKIEYSDVFNGFYYNEAANKNHSERYGYFKNGVIVLNDKQKVVEYEIVSGKSTKFTFEEYEFFENELDYKITDNNRITFTQNSVEKTLTLEELKKSNGVISEICSIYDEKIWDKDSGLKHFFDSVQFINDKVYLLCRVLNYHGHTSVVVLEYDFETNSCKYVCSEFISDVIFGNYYLIDSIQQETNESATPLTEAEIKELFLDAHKLFVDWLSPAAKHLNVDWDKTTTIDGVEYFEVVSTEITSVDALKNEFVKYFSEEIIEENIDKYYVMHNGKMYGNAVLIEGGEIPTTKYELTVKSNTSTECNITITSYIEDSKTELNYKLKVIDGEWKFVGAFNWVTTDETFNI